MAIEHITGGGIGVAFSVVVYAVIRAISWFLARNKVTTEVKVDSNPGLPHQQDEELRAIYIHVTEQKIQLDYLRADVRNLKEGQEKVEGRITELIISQQKLTDRLSDLISSMDRLMDKMKS